MVRALGELYIQTSDPEKILDRVLTTSPGPWDKGTVKDRTEQLKARGTTLQDTYQGLT